MSIPINFSYLSSSWAKCLSRICFSMKSKLISLYVMLVLYDDVSYFLLHYILMFSIFFREGLGLDSLSTLNAPLFGCTFFNELGVHFTKLARQFHGGPSCQKTSKLSTKSLLPFLLFLTILMIVYHCLPLFRQSKEKRKSYANKIKLT